MKPIKSFGERLQYLIDEKKISQKVVVDDLGMHKSQVSKLVAKREGVPRRETLHKLTEYFRCNFDWLSTGKGEPFPGLKTETPPSVEVAVDRRFIIRRQQDLENEVAAKTRRDRFKMQCLGLLDELYDYVGDRFGEDREAVDHFLERLEKLDPEFGIYRAEKKAARDNLASLRGGAKIANNGE